MWDSSYFRDNLITFNQVINVQGEGKGEHAFLVTKLTASTPNPIEDTLLAAASVPDGKFGETINGEYPIAEAAGAERGCGVETPLSEVLGGYGILPLYSE